MQVMFQVNRMEGRDVAESAWNVVENFPPEALPSNGDGVEFSKIDAGYADWKDPVVRKRRVVFDPTAKEQYWIVQLKTDSVRLIQHLVKNKGWNLTCGWKAEDE